ncbi:MAG: hypothetical protein KC422_06380 [Trueperaceae bacterium]|nr:hypothetical protein [Trueperaceae bacterium]
MSQDSSIKKLDQEDKKTFTFDNYTLDVESVDSVDALIIRGRLLHAQQSSDTKDNQDVTLLQHHVMSSMDSVLNLDENGYFEAHCRKNDDYVLRFLTSKETFAVPITN